MFKKTPPMSCSFFGHRSNHPMHAGSCRPKRQYKKRTNKPQQGHDQQRAEVIVPMANGTSQRLERNFNRRGTP
jgi:hypothetical protein